MAVCNVNIITGDVYHSAVDCFLRGPISFRFIRNYNSGLKKKSSLGNNWSHNHLAALILKEGSAEFLSPEGEIFSVPHPDYPPTGLDSGELTTCRKGNIVLLSDSLSTSYKFEQKNIYNPNLHLIARIDPHGNSFDYHYDSHGNITWIKDILERQILFSYDEFGHITKLVVNPSLMSEAQQEYILLEYDSAGNLRKTRDRTGGVTRYNYEGYLLTEQINPLGGKTIYQYDDLGRCVYTSREDGTQARTFIRDDNQNSVSVQDTRGAQWTYVYNEKKRPLLEIDPSGNRKEYFYDDSGDLMFTNSSNEPQSVSLFFEDRKTLINQSGPLTTTTEFDEKMRVVKATKSSGSNLAYKYDEKSNRIEIQDTNQFIWRFDYEQDGWLSSTQDPRGFRINRTRKSPLEVEITDEIGLQEMYQYTSLGLLSSVIDSLGRPTKIEYAGDDLLSVIRYSDGTILKFDYDAMGNMICATTASGVITNFEYDRFGTVIRMKTPLGYSAIFTHDTEGNLVSVRNLKGELATFTYNLLNQVIATVSFDGLTRRYIYDAQGNITSVRDDDNSLILALLRDDYGRIVKKIYPSGWDVSYEWGEQGQLLAARNPDASLKIEWTSDLKIAAEHVNDHSVFYEYDEVGNRKKLSTNKGREINYFWDARNRLTKLIDVGRAEYQFTYDSVDLFQEMIGPSVIHRFEFDELRRMTKRSTFDKQAGQPISVRSFQYNASGELSVMQDTRLGEYSYRYNIQGAIIEARKSDGSYLEEYEWDANGNMIRMRDRGLVSYGIGNRVLRAGDRIFEHSRNGEITRMSEAGKDMVLEYNSEGRLIKCTNSEGVTIEYKYDPLGRRLFKKVGEEETHYDWDQNTYLSEHSHTQETVDYLFLPQTFIPLGLTDQTEHYSMILDQAAAPTEMVDNNGNIVWSGDFTIWGEMLGAKVAMRECPFRFQGQYYDKETGLHYNYSRYYLPRLARFISQDPLGLEADANLYFYVQNPLSWVDPFGLKGSWSFTGGVLTVVPPCAWKGKLEIEARKKIDAQNAKIAGKGGWKLEKQERCEGTAKKKYEECQEKVKKKEKRPLSESSDPCHNEQADHIWEQCGGGEDECHNLHPLNEKVNKSFGSILSKVVAKHNGEVINSVQLAPMKDCRQTNATPC